MSNVGTPKIDNISQMTGVQHTPFLQQVEGVITDADGTLIESDSLQFRQAINSYASIANFYIDTGTATEYVLNPQGSFKSPIDAPSTWNGMLIRFRPTHNNIGVATLKLAGLNGGLAFNILREDGTTIQAGDFLTTRDAILRYNQDINAFILLNSNLYAQINTAITTIIQIQQRIALSYNSATSLDYSSGSFIFDDFSGRGFVSAGTLNLTGLTANASWYIFAIANPITGQAQIQHYNSLTPTLPTGFTKKKLLFAFRTNGSSQLRAMKIHNLPNAYKVEYLTNIQEYLSYVVPVAGELKTFTVPEGVEVEVQGSYRKNSHGANNLGIGFTHPSKTSLANDGSFFSYTGVASVIYDFGASFKSFTDTNRQIRISATALTSLDIIYTWGYIIYL